MHRRLDVPAQKVRGVRFLFLNHIARGDVLLGTGRTMRRGWNRNVHVLLSKK